MKPVTPGHRVLVKPRKLEAVDPVVARAKALGITISKTTEQMESSGIDIGTVVEIGPTAFAEFGGADKWCKVGDVVSYVRHGGKFVSDPDDHSEDPETWLVLNDEDIVLVWESN